jgi:predicted transcriptional regulator
VIAVNDQETDMRALLQGGNYQLPVILDPSGAVGSEYGLRAVPTLVIVDPQGRIAKVHVGGLSAADLSAAVDGAAR